MRKLFLILSFLPVLFLVQGQTIIQANSSYTGVAGNGESTLLTGLISYWKFDEASGDAIDAHASNDGTVDATYGETGKIGDCYEYDGSTDEVDFGNNSNLKPTGAMSISCWYKHYSYQGSIMGTYSGGDGYGFFTEDGGEPAFQLYSDWTTAQVDGTTSVTTGEPTVWYHIVATWDGDYIRMYVNSTQEGGDVAFAPDITYNADNVFAGYAPTLGSRNSENLDELGIWNRALTQDEIDELYSSGSGLTYPFE